MLNRREAIRLLAAAPMVAGEFRSTLPTGIERTWIGPEYWANPLQDWRLKDGRIECAAPGGDRNVYLLTHEATAGTGTLSLRVKLGRLTSGTQEEGFAGFRVGIKGVFHEYRDSAIYGFGLNAGLSADGSLFIGRVSDGAPRLADLHEVELTLTAQPSGDGYRIELRAVDSSGRAVSVSRDGVTPEWLTGGVALVCSSGPIGDSPDPSSVAVTMSGIQKRGSERKGDLGFWFKDWQVSGSKVAVYPDRAWGPILFAMHTLSRGVMKLTAQMPPMGLRSEPVRLQIRQGNRWKTVASSAMDSSACTATFRIAGWDDRRDHAYRLVCATQDSAGAPRDHYFEGTIRKDPVGKAKLVVAAMSCLNDLGFPHNDAVRNVAHFKPDLLIFTGDQIYERVAGYGIQRLPLEIATLDYLRKWFVFGWTFRDLMRDTPAVCMPDDHDVYHGNLWGAGGRHADGVGQPGQDSGGYVEPAAWVNMVQRTQTSHLPDPFDPAPVEQGIGVYYSHLCYGGVSFAILEDRKWKSAPKRVLPIAQIVNGWAQNPEYNAARDGDASGAQLLGERQMKFLEAWAKDWRGAALKAVISQTLFANVATLPPPANTDAVTSKLPILPAGGYPEGEVLVADHDSNSWPQTARNEALRAWRRACAFHITGDQHLGSTVQYGVDDWNDAAWAVCVPAFSNFFPRRWYPPMEGKNRKAGSPRNTGEYTDGFGNKVTVHAVLNPQAVMVEPVAVNQRAPGYCTIEFDCSKRKITVANWPRWVDVTQPGAKPAEGWPITLDQTANGLPHTGWRLDTIQVSEADAIVEVVAEGNGETLYTLRISGRSFMPTVLREGAYTVRVTGARGQVLLERKNQRARREKA